MSSNETNGPSRGDKNSPKADRVLRRRWRYALPFAALTIFALLLAHLPTMQSAWAQSPDWQSEGQPVRHVVVTVNKSRTFQLGQPFSTAVVGAPDIADALPMNDRTLYIQGKKIGTTNVSVFDTNNKLMGVLDVEVAIDTQSLQNRIRLSTGSNGIRVSSSNGQIILTGMAPNAVVGDRAVSIVQSVAPNGVINAMSIAPSQQVLLKVKFLEASRTAGRELGVNWFASNAAGTRGVTTGLGQVTSTNGSTTAGGGGCSTVTTFPVLQPLFQASGTLAQGTPFGVVLAQMVNGGTNIDALITALETQGLVRRLAEPNLMALSGDLAKFLGRRRVSSADRGDVGERHCHADHRGFEPFGVKLFHVRPYRGGIINLRMCVHVRRSSIFQSVSISAPTIPSLIKRDADTTVELRDDKKLCHRGLAACRQCAQSLANPLARLGAGAGRPVFEQQLPEKRDRFGHHRHAASGSAGGSGRTPGVAARQAAAQQRCQLLEPQMEVPNRYSDYVTTGGGVVGPYGHIIRVEPTSDVPMVK